MRRRAGNPGQLIVLEGPDGVGKSSTALELLGLLKEASIEATLLSFPGRAPGTLGELVYRAHHDLKSLGPRSISDVALQAMHVAAHLDTIESQIAPALSLGGTVVLDRFWWSTWVYGSTAGCEPGILKSLIAAELRLWHDFPPRLVVLLRRNRPVGREVDMRNWRKLDRSYTKLLEEQSSSHPVLTLANTAGPLEAARHIIQVLYGPAANRSATKPVCERKPNAPASYASHVLPIKPSVVFDTYWRFAAERQAVYMRRLSGAPPPWSADPILAEFKFTNAYRAADRVSQYLIRNVIYRDDLPKTADELFFRILLFKTFNKIDTWLALEAHVGPVVFEDFDIERYSHCLSDLMASGKRVYSGAYIMPSGSVGGGRKHEFHLSLIHRMMADAMPARIAESRSMQQAFKLLKGYPSIGDFLAYQYVTDLNYSELTNFSESEFVVPGPGALDGIRKVFVNLGGLNEPEIIKFVADRQEREFERLGIDFETLWGRRLQFIDCQNLFCEVDKYSRVRHPEIKGISGRQRIKQRFEPKARLSMPWFPPKWRINGAVEHWYNSRPKVAISDLDLFASVEETWS